MTELAPTAAAPAARQPAPTINPAILSYVPRSLILASDPAVRQGMLWMIKAYGRNLPKGVDENSAVLIMFAAMEYGIDPVVGISKLFMVGGRIAPSANTMMELAIANGLSIKPLIESDEVWEAEFSRPGRESITMRYTIEEARKAQLLGSDTWKKHPRWMLRARCVSAAIRVYAADLVKGAEYSAEELANGSGYFDPAGNFTPDDSVVGPNPAAKDFVPHEGRASDNRPAPEEKAAEAKPAAEVAVTVTAVPAAQVQEKTFADVTAQVAAQAGVQTRSPEVDVLAEGRVIPLIRLANHELDFTKSIESIFAAVVQVTGDEAAAKVKMGEFMKQAGVPNSKALKGSPKFIQVYLLADEFVAAQQAAPAAKPEVAAPEIPAFNPRQGARTASATAPVADAEESVTPDQTITALYTQLAERSLSTDADRVLEDTGYADEAEGSSTSIKLETIKRLQELAQAS